MDISKSKTLILGTSNSIKKDGYYSFLSGNSLFKRESIGDCSSIVGIYNLLKRQDFSDTKYAILDFFVNEITFIINDNYPLEWCVSTFSFCIKYLVENDVIPIILLIDKKNFSWLENFHELISSKLNIPVINTAAILSKFSFDPYGGDSLHLNPNASKIVADHIIKKINELDQDNNYLEKIQIPTEIQNISFTNLEKEFPIDKNEHIQNSLLSLDLYNLKNDKTLLVKSNNYLCGIIYYTDAFTSYCTFTQIDSNYSITKNLHHKFFRPIVVARSIGYSEENKQICGDFSISLDSTNQCTEKTHNSVDNTENTNEKHLLINDLIFSNVNLRQQGKKILLALNMENIIYKYKFWHLVLRKNVNTMQIEEILTNIASFNTEPEYLYYILKFKRPQIDKFKNFNKNKYSNYYTPYLLGKNSTNIDDLNYFFNEVFKLKQNYPELYYDYAFKLFKLNYLNESLIAVEKSIELNSDFKPSIDLREIIVEKLKQNDAATNNVLQFASKLFLIKSNKT